MKRRTIGLYLLLFAAALFLTAYSGAVPKEKPLLQLELVLPKKQFKAGEPIECKAVLTYVGEEDLIKVYFDNPIITFSLDGGEYLHGEMADYPRNDVLPVPPARTMAMKKGEAIEFWFQKQQYAALGSRNFAEEEAEAFWDHYLSSSELVLEPGRYRILARCRYSFTYVLSSGPFREINVIESIIVK